MVSEAERLIQMFEDSEEVELYSDGAPLFEAVYSGFDTEDSKESAVRKNVEEGSRILDVACGTGILAERLDPDYDITGLDNSRDMIEVARGKDLDAAFVQGDMRSMPFQDEFDAVIMFGQPVSHLSSYQDVEDAFESAYSALEERGVMLTEFYDKSAGMIPLLEPIVAEIDGGKIAMTAQFTDYDRTEGSWTGELYFDIYQNGDSRELVSRQDLQGFSQYDIGESLMETGFSLVDSEDVYTGNMNHVLKAVK